MGRVDPGDPPPLPALLRQGGNEKTQLADPLLGKEDLGHRPQRPAAARKERIQRREAGGEDRRAPGLLRPAAQPEVRTGQEGLQRLFHNVSPFRSTPTPIPSIASSARSGR